MKQNKMKLLLMGLCAISLLFTACDKDNYIIGGEPTSSDRYKNTSTYDMLKGNIAFDTLIQVIDAAGFKDLVNQDGQTFFAPQDISIFNYLNARTLQVQALYDKNKKFALDSLLYYVSNNIKGTKDSLKLYLINKPLPYNALTAVGSVYTTQLPGDKAIVSYEETKDGNLGYSTNVSSYPKLVFFTHLWYPYEVSTTNPAKDVPNTIGVRTLVKTSNIQTKNGVVHTLDPVSHTLFFFGTKR